MRGMGVEKTEPAHALHRRELFQQPGKARIVHIRAVMGGVLADEDQFTNADRHQFLRLADDFILGNAPEVAADDRDVAVGADVVAALGNLQVGGVTGAGNHAGVERLSLRVEFQQAQAQFRDLVALGKAHHGVNLGEVAFQFLTVDFRQAAGGDEDFRPPGLLVPGDLEDGLDGLLTGAFDETAGVDNDDLGLLLGNEFEPERDQTAHDAFGIHLVHGTAESHQRGAGFPGFLHGCFPD